MLLEQLSSIGFDVSNFVIAPYQRENEPEVYLLRVDKNQVLKIAMQIREISHELGYWPVVGWDRFKDPGASEESSANIIRDSNDIDVLAWFIENGILSINQNVMGVKVSRGKHVELNFKIQEGRFTNTPYPLVPIAFVPTIKSWQSPAYLRLPEDSQAPSVHVAILKFWNARYKSDIVAMNSGEIEMEVLNPPQTLDEAITLAKQQYIYSPDIVDQGTGSIQVLASQLVKGAVWRFWWD